MLEFLDEKCKLYLIQPLIFNGFAGKHNGQGKAG